jgi:CheY-like chemotaxis protein
MAVILIAEDDPDVRMVLERIARRAGFTVLAAGDGQEALELFALHHPDIVLTDLDMPRMTGLQLCSSIRADAGWSATPVALISGSLTRNDPRAVEVQACAVQLKPFTTSDLVAAIRTLADLGPHSHSQPGSRCPLIRQATTSPAR